MVNRKSSALVLLSGGQDSTTCLFWAKALFDNVYAVTFNYGQRHGVEIGAAKKIAGMAGINSHELINIGEILVGESPLINEDCEVGEYDSINDLPHVIEPTFVPSRNVLFLAIAGNRAVQLRTKDIVIGVSQEDFAGYPDCRDTFIIAMERALSLGLSGSEKDIKIHAPLMRLDKRGAVLVASMLDGCMDALAYSHTCYRGQFPPCGKCHACLLREKGFKEAGMADPLIERSQ